MSRADPSVWLRHMHDYAADARAMVAGSTKEEVADTRVLLYALTHAVEIIGEAATHVPEETRGKAPQIPWGDIIGMRNRLIHGYWQVDIDRLWDTVTSDLPVLMEEVARLLREPD